MQTAARSATVGHGAATARSTIRYGGSGETRTRDQRIKSVETLQVLLTNVSTVRVAFANCPVKLLLQPAHTALTVYARLRMVSASRGQVFSLYLSSTFSSVQFPQSRHRDNCSLGSFCGFWLLQTLYLLGSTLLSLAFSLACQCQTRVVDAAL